MQRDFKTWLLIKQRKQIQVLVVRAFSQYAKKTLIMVK